MIDSIVARFGVSSYIIMDNGKYFTTKHVRKFCKGFNIKKGFSYTYFPYGNGQVQAINNIIINILCKIVKKHQRD